MSRKHIYHQENCDRFVRETIIDTWGRTIVLSGQHAFEWTITICTKTTMVTTKYPNGKKARKEFYKYKRKK
jgi:hypothetical protein